MFKKKHTKNLHPHPSALFSWRLQKHFAKEMPIKSILPWQALQIRAPQHPWGYCLLCGIWDAAFVCLYASSQRVKPEAFHSFFILATFQDTASPPDRKINKPEATSACLPLPSPIPKLMKKYLHCNIVLCNILHLMFPTEFGLFGKKARLNQATRPLYLYIVVHAVSNWKKQIQFGAFCRIPY